MFDIEEQKQAAGKEDEGTRVHVRDVADELAYHENSEGKQLPVIIVVAGANSKRMRRAEEAIRRRKIKPGKLTSETFHNDTIEKAVACTIGWEGIGAGGKPIEFTPENASMLYKTCPFILDQVVDAQHDHSRFIGSSSSEQ